MLKSSESFLEIMSNRLETFVREHPEFFEKEGGYWNLNSDIRDLMDRYSRAYDKEEYERLRVLVEEARDKERERLQREIDKWKQAASEEKERTQEIETHLQAIDKSIDNSQLRILKSEMLSKPKPVPAKGWYNSAFVFLLLALAGVTFIYLGIILNERASMSYFLGGISCLALGVYLQSSGPKVQSSRERVGALHKALVNEEEGSMKIARIRRATLLEKMRAAQQSEASASIRINRSLAKLNNLNG